MAWAMARVLNVVEADDDHVGDPLVLDRLLSLLVAAGAVYVSVRLVLFASHELRLRNRTRLLTQHDTAFDDIDYFYFRLDFLFSSSAFFKVQMLLSIIVALILVGGLCLYGIGQAGGSAAFFESLWVSWTFIADAGTHSTSSTGLLRLVSLLLTLCGMVIFALVVGIFSEVFSSYVDSLRKGKSRVIASMHTLILGQGDKLIPLIAEICKANASEGGGLVVVLCAMEKQAMEQIIEDAKIHTMGSDIIVRSGSSASTQDLLKVSAPAARSVVVLSDRQNNDADGADVVMVRTVLSLRSIHAPQRGHITAEVSDVDNEDLVRMDPSSYLSPWLSPSPHPVSPPGSLSLSLTPGAHGGGREHRDRGRPRRAGALDGPVPASAGAVGRLDQAFGLRWVRILHARVAAARGEDVRGGHVFVPFRLPDWHRKKGGQPNILEPSL